MIEMFGSMFRTFQTIITTVCDLISNMIAGLIMVADGLKYINTLIFIIPGGLLIFGLCFLIIFIINRLSFGSNGGGS